MANCFLSINGETVGPLSEQEIVQQFTEGRVTLDTLVWRDGVGEWISLRDSKMPLHSASATSPLKEFHGAIKPVATSLFYKIGLVMVTAGMILLPLIYILFIALTAYGIFWHASNDYQPIMGISGSNYRIWILKIMLYVTPILAGGIIVFFMIKPFFAGKGHHAQPLALNSQDEPVLFSFIGKICQQVGAPFPTRIYLDCHLNASASFHGGFSGFFKNELVLTIGLPLVSGLTMQQFAGVLAHEFGHFTQGAGMRLTYIIRKINRWFARVVYERDAWDEWLESCAQIDDNRVAIVVAFCRFGVWISRKVLQLLLMMGHGISCFMLRQMEYDADTYEIRLSGSQSFESTVRRLAILSAASGVAYKQMRKTWDSERKLPKSVPGYIIETAQSMPRDIQERIDSTLGLNKTKVFDTHPSDADRIRCARKASEPGIFALTRPATELFSSFEFPAKFVTLIHYQDDLGIPVKENSLV